MKGRLAEKLAAVFCALCLTTGVMSGLVFARGEEVAEEPEAPQATFVILDELVPETAEPVLEVTDNRTSVPVFADGEPRGACRILSGQPCMAPDEFCRAVGLDPSVSAYDGTCTVSCDGLLLTAEAGEPYFVCNDRYLYVPGGIAEQGGQVLLPVELLAKCLGVSAAWDRVAWTLNIRADRIEPLESGSTYYVDTDVYWLSHVIYAEAGNQPLLGKIAVGSVVMNRIANEAFGGQDSVYDVIFAKNQFEVVINGMIYMEPDAESLLAAKLALEGADVVNGATYFATFDFGEGYETVMWIGDHCFMKDA